MRVKLILKMQTVNEEYFGRILLGSEKYDAKSFSTAPIMFSTVKQVRMRRAPRNASAFWSIKVNVEEWLERNAKDSLILRTTGVFDYIRARKLSHADDFALGIRSTKFPQIRFLIESGRAISCMRPELLAWQKSGHGVAGGSWISRTEFSAHRQSFDLDPYIDSIETADLGQKAKDLSVG